MNAFWNQLHPLPEYEWRNLLSDFQVQHLRQVLGNEHSGYPDLMDRIEHTYAFLFHVNLQVHELNELKRYRERVEQLLVATPINNDQFQRQMLADELLQHLLLMIDDREEELYVDMYQMENGPFIGFEESLAHLVDTRRVIEDYKRQLRDAEQYVSKVLRDAYQKVHFRASNRTPAAA